MLWMFMYAYRKKKKKKNQKNHPNKIISTLKQIKNTYNPQPLYFLHPKNKGKQLFKNNAYA